MNEIFKLRNIANTIGNPRDLEIQVLKTMYCGLETIAYKGPQLWQKLPAKIKASSSLASGRTLSCGKTLNVHFEFARLSLEDWNFCYYYYCYYHYNCYYYYYYY